jgi:hypothetical protein
MTESIAHQYVACKFRDYDTRTYTYHWDGEPFAAGDIVRIEDRDGDGWKRVTVVSVSDQKPAFSTKPILGPFIEPEVQSLAL